MHQFERATERLKGQPPKLAFAFGVQCLLLIPWLPLAALSAMAYDNGKLWPGIIFVGPFQAYPILILVFLGIATQLSSAKKYKAANVFAWLPLMISGGSIALFSFVGSVLVSYAQITG